MNIKTKRNFQRLFTSQKDMLKESWYSVNVPRALALNINKWIIIPCLHFHINEKQINEVQKVNINTNINYTFKSQQYDMYRRLKNT